LKQKQYHFHPGTLHIRLAGIVNAKLLQLQSRWYSFTLICPFCCHGY